MIVADGVANTEGSEDRRHTRIRFLLASYPTALALFRERRKKRPLLLHAGSFDDEPGTRPPSSNCLPWLPILTGNAGQLSENRHNRPICAHFHSGDWSLRISARILVRRFASR